MDAPICLPVHSIDWSTLAPQTTEHRIKNVRYPVLFQKAVEKLYSGDTVPDVVLEIGPHQTLVSPIKQVRACTGFVSCGRRWRDSYAGLVSFPFS
jgi:acyl transferase domain-containing protein